MKEISETKTCADSADAAVNSETDFTENNGVAVSVDAGVNREADSTEDNQDADSLNAGVKRGADSTENNEYADSVDTTVNRGADSTENEYADSVDTTVNRWADSTENEYADSVDTTVNRGADSTENEYADSVDTTVNREANSTENNGDADSMDTGVNRESNSTEKDEDAERPPKRPKQEQDDEQTECNGLFFFDKTGDKSEDPPYCTTIYVIESEEEEKEEKEGPAAGDGGPRVECFNCGGNHLLGVCKKKIDAARVSQKRREMARERDAAPKKLRYFEHEMLSQRFRPGVYSAELRKALNLDPSDLPPFIYRMRVIGYPPGWLMHAQVESSGIKIYGLDDDDKANADDVEEGEEGEIKAEENQVKYDPSLLLSFPGFNTPVPEGVYDMHVEKGMPPLLPHQQLSAAEKYMKSEAPLAKSFSERQKVPAPAVKPSTDVGAVVDMTIDDGAEEEQVCFATENILADTTADSNGSSTTQESPAPDTPGISSNCPNSTTPRSTESDRPEQPSPLSSENGNTSNSEDCTPCTSKVKPQNVYKGTPMFLGLHSKILTLPPRENFAKDIQEHIPFENLPGATGRYDKLRGVIAKVRALRQKSKEES